MIHIYLLYVIEQTVLEQEFLFILCAFISKISGMTAGI